MNWKLLIGLVGALIIGFATVQTLRLDHAKHDLTAARSALAAQTALTAAEKVARVNDQQTASASYTALGSRCDADVSAALASGRKIAGIVSRPVPASGRGMVSGDDLNAVVFGDVK